MSRSHCIMLVACVMLSCILARCSEAAEIRDDGVWLERAEAARLVAKIEAGRDALDEYRSLLIECESALDMELVCPACEAPAYDWWDHVLWGLAGVGVGLVVGILLTIAL